MQKAVARLTEGLKVDLTIREHTLVADEPLHDGGTNQGPQPTELLVAALAGCVALTVKLYAQRKQFPLEGIEVEANMTRHKAAEYPGYTGDALNVNEFIQKIRFIGDDLTDQQKERMLEIAAKCPVHRILTQPNVFVEELIAAEETAK